MSNWFNLTKQQFYDHIFADQKITTLPTENYNFGSKSYF